MCNEVFFPEQFVAPEVEEHFIFTDPWEEFEKNITASVEPSSNVCVTGCSYNDTVQNFNENNEIHNNFHSWEDNPRVTFNECQPLAYNTHESPVHYQPPVHYEPPVYEPKLIEPAPVRYENPTEVNAAPVNTQSNFSGCENGHCCSSRPNENQQNFETEQISVNNETYVNDDVNHGSFQNLQSCDNSVNTNYSSLHSLKNEILREENSNSECKNKINDDVSNSVLM